MWDKVTCKQIGSLVLGTGTSQNGELTAAEKRKYANIWKIKVDKRTRYNEDRSEAQKYVEETEQMDYETMFIKGKHNNFDFSAGDKSSAIKQK